MINKQLITMMIVSKLFKKYKIKQKNNKDKMKINKGNKKDNIKKDNKDNRKNKKLQNNRIIEV